MGGVLPLTPYMPVCCTQGQIEPFVGPYFEYLNKFNCTYLRILYPAYEGVSSRAPYPLPRNLYKCSQNCTVVA
jgi:hypothetical protein